MGLMAPPAAIVMLPLQNPSIPTAARRLGPHAAPGSSVYSVVMRFGCVAAPASRFCCGRLPGWVSDALVARSPRAGADLAAAAISRADLTALVTLRSRSITTTSLSLCQHGPGTPSIQLLTLKKPFSEL